MRWTWVRAIVLGLLIGPAPADAETGAIDSQEPEELSAEETLGYALDGPGFYVWEEEASAAEQWAYELRRSVATTTQSTRWRAIAARTAVRSLISLDDEELEFAGMQASIARPGVPPLGLLLCLLPSLDRTCLVSSLATSSHEPTRLALARALAAPFEAVGVRSALELLQDDPSAEVRTYARSAARVRSPFLA